MRRACLPATSWQQRYFGKAARRATKRAGGARLELSVKPPAGGKAVRRTVALKLARR